MIEFILAAVLMSSDLICVKLESFAPSSAAVAVSVVQDGITAWGVSAMVPAGGVWFADDHLGNEVRIIWKDSGPGWLKIELFYDGQQAGYGPIYQDRPEPSCVSLFRDEIFSDGFESGSVESWSLSAGSG